MCGRFTLVNDQKALEAHYKKQMRSYRGPNYNVAPTQSVPIVTPDGIIDMRWGLVPQWAKSLNTGYSMINAMAETLTEKPTYKYPLLHQRCLVPASGFYEWLQTDEGKLPQYFTVKNRDLFSFAGLYVVRKDSEGQELFSFTIITTTPNKVVERIHNRMPVILSLEEEADWLNPEITDPALLLPMLDPYPSDDLAVMAVGKDVGSVKNNGPELILPINPAAA